MDKVRLEDGREVDVYRLAGFLYGLSASDVELLKVILEQREVTTEYLAERLKVTKASVSKGLNNILDRGLISRDRAMRNGGKGRPILHLQGRTGRSSWPSSLGTCSPYRTRSRRPWKRALRL